VASISEMIERLWIRKPEYSQVVGGPVLRSSVTRQIDPADGWVSLALPFR
jgi:hypothetical protein